MVLRLGCSNHMTGNIAMFANFDENVKSEVTIGTIVRSLSREKTD